MKYVWEIIKGILIGIANIIPGVSGGTIAVSTGVYETILHAVNHLRTEFKKSIKTLLPYGIGIVIGIVALSFVIHFLLEQYEMPTIACFIGLVLGGVPLLLNQVKDEKVKWTHGLSFVIMLAVIIVPTLIAIETPAVETVALSLGSVLLLLVLGAISAATMVIPGVSGSMILMMLGYYEWIVATVKTTMEALLHLDFVTFGSGCLLLLPFAIGVIAGILMIAKIMEWVLKRYPNVTRWAILGLIVASPFAIILKSHSIIGDAGMLFLCLLTFGIGFWISYALGKKEKS